jgi:hypothetical protein
MQEPLLRSSKRSQMHTVFLETLIRSVTTTWLANMELELKILPQVEVTKLPAASSRNRTTGMRVGAFTEIISGTTSVIDSKMQEAKPKKTPFLGTKGEIQKLRGRPKSSSSNFKRNRKNIMKK